MFYDDVGHEWQVWLERPSQNQLDRGEIQEGKEHTTKLCENRIAFYTTDITLMGALLQLQDCFYDPELEDFDA